MKAWSLKWEIEKRAQLESLVEWSKTLEVPLPKYEKEHKKVEPLSAGIYNLVRQLLP